MERKEESPGMSTMHLLLELESSPTEGFGEDGLTLRVNREVLLVCFFYLLWLCPVASLSIKFMSFNIVLHSGSVSVRKHTVAWKSRPQNSDR